MAFCINCGQELVRGAKFCANCGVAVNATKTNTERKTVYEGELHKCPCCGEVLKAFEANCPACGHELRGTNSSSSVKEFALKIAQSKRDSEKIILIRNFPIPNTKEDVFEFMILASTNVKSESNKNVFNAWLAKFEQCYYKAKLLFESDKDFKSIKETYEQTTRTVNKGKVVREAKSTGYAVVHFFLNMKNPIFGVSCCIVLLVNIITIINGTFESDGTNIFYSIVILAVVYILTSIVGKKRKEKE